MRTAIFLTAVLACYGQSQFEVASTRDRSGPHPSGRGRRSTGGHECPDSAVPAAAAAADVSGPDFLTAMQEQLGLKLEQTKGPVEVIAVDRAEKASAN